MSVIDFNEFVSHILLDYMRKSSLKKHPLLYSLGPGPNRRREEDIGVVFNDIENEDLMNRTWFNKNIIEVAGDMLVGKLFEQGQPLGFYDLILPKGVDFTATVKGDEPFGVSVRYVVVFNIVRNSYTVRFDLRPEYDAAVVDQIVAAREPTVSKPLISLN
jgi:hypothetical protein